MEFLKAMQQQEGVELTWRDANPKDLEKTNIIWVSTAHLRKHELLKATADFDSYLELL